MTACGFRKPDAVDSSRNFIRDQIPMQDISTGPTKLNGDASPASAGAGRFWALAIILTLLTLARLFGARMSVVDLFYDESQYWSWANDLALGYPTKPPLLAWLLAGTRQVCGDAEWCVRSPAPIFHMATAIAVYLAGRQLYDDRVAFWSSLLMAFAPGIVFSTRIISTDVPLLFFWTVALLAYVKFLQISPTPRAWGVLLGLCLGLGLLSKYAMIYFLAGMLLASFIIPSAARAWKDPAMWLAFLTAAAVSMPNLVWNVQHSFDTFRHTGGLVLDEPFQPSALRALEFLGSQFAVMGPVVFAVMMIAAARCTSTVLTSQDRLMLAFFITPVVVVTAFAIYSRAFPNWAAPSAISAFIGSAALLVRTSHWYLLAGSVAFGVLLQAALLVVDTVATRLPTHIGGFSNPYNRILVWRGYAEEVGRVAAAADARTIVTDDRRTFNTLRYYLRDRPQTIVSWKTVGELPYDLAHPLTPAAAEPILFVTGCPDTDRLKDHFSRVEPLGIHPATHGNRVRFRAFKLSQATGQAGSLQPCGP